MPNRDFVSLKMRASLGGAHISGAERLVARADVPATAAQLMTRALSHEKGAPDFLQVKMEAVAPDALVTLPALPVTVREAATPEAGRAVMREVLAAEGITPKRVDEIFAKFSETYGMRGAMLLNVDTLERLEPDPARGVRATYMDGDASRFAIGNKNHFAEAVVLATKVANAPGVIGEICVSDDPAYTTGYVATKRAGYVRLPNVKAAGDPNGGRIFLFRGTREDAVRAIEFLEHTPVLVTNVPAPPRAGSVACAACTVADANPLAPLAEELAAIDASHLRRTLPAPSSSSALVLASNDYLALAQDERVRRAAADAALAFGGGTGGARLTTGNTALAEALEADLAAFKHAEACTLFATGYMANVGTISALVGKGDVIFSDALNHASIIDGCRLSGAKIFVYPHNDMTALADGLARVRGAARRVLVVTDAVFSMDGDLAPLPELRRITREAGAWLMIDEAHATGVVGATGHGLMEHFGMSPCNAPEVLLGTLSKALGAEGGYVCGSRVLIDYLRNKARSFIFSTAPAPAGLAAAREALRILREEPARVTRLQQNVCDFLAALAAHGIAAQSESAIVPIVLGDEARAMRVAETLRDKHNILASGIRYPTVARGAARLRIALHAGLTPADIARAAAAVADVLK